MNASLFNSKSWKCEAFEPYPIPETIWPIVLTLDLKPLTNWQGVDISELQEVIQPMIEGCLLSFYTDKIEKLTASFHIYMKRMAVTILMIAPNDDYDFPMLSLMFTEDSGSVQSFVDMHPLRDLVIDPWYREKYLDPVEPIWKEYQDVQIGISPSAWYRALLSPFFIGRWKLEGSDKSGLSRAADCLAKYVEYYIKYVIRNAEPVKNPEAKESAIKRKRAIRETYRTNEYREDRELVKASGVNLAKIQFFAIP